MAENDDELEDFDLDGGAGKAPSKVALIVAVLFGLGGGGAVGMTALGEKVGPVLAERALAAPADDGHGGGGSHGEPGPSPITVIDNLVVNPARSGGQRFLLASIGIEVFDAELSEVVEAKEVQIRSSLILVLGAKTTDELSGIEFRDGIVREIHDAVVEIMGPDVVRHVFIPQFVIQ